MATNRIKSFHEWLRADPRRTTATWLILGKGPSFSRLADLDTAGMLRFGLNHVVRETRIDVFHCIDIEVIDHCAKAILENAGIAVLPWAPHLRGRLVPFSGYREFLPSGASLADYVERFPVLRRLADEDRLFWYNLRTAPRRLRRPEMPLTPARGFSASAAVALLAAGGVRRIRTLGIDGGRRYAGSFDDLAGKTLLAAGQNSFDSQFTAIAGHIGNYELDLTPMDRPAPARILIGADAANLLPAQVLAHSLRRRASLSVAVTLVCPDYPDRLPPVDGSAIYLDAGCLALADLRGPWMDADAFAESDVGTDGSDPLGTPILLASAVDGQQRGGWVAPPTRWRPMTADEEDRGWLIHWPSHLPQPWSDASAPQGWRWCAELLSAVADGAIDRELIETEIARDHIRPSLLVQIDRGLVEPCLLPRRATAADRRAAVDGVAIPQNQRVDDYARFAAYRRTIARAIHWPKLRRWAGLLVDKGWKILRGVPDNAMK